MKTKLTVTGLVLLLISTSARAHRLDEYLQATTFSLEKDRVQAQIRLTAGVAVFSRVMSAIDTDGDGVLSTREQRSYAESVLRDLSLAMDGERLKLALISTSFPDTDAMKQGLGEIVIEFGAALSHGGAERRLVFVNQHQKPIGTYLVNCLVPRERGTLITGQRRNYEQSRYELTYSQSTSTPSERRAEGHSWLWPLVLLLLAGGAVLLRQRCCSLSRNRSGLVGEFARQPCRGGTGSEG